MADIDDLKAAYEQYVTVFNAHNLDGWISMHHNQAVIFDDNTPFAADGKATVQQVFHTLFDNTESAIFTPVSPQFRVIGSGAIIWAHYAFAVKPKDGPLQTTFGRVTLTWVKVEGKWLVLNFHMSRLSVGS